MEPSYRYFVAIGKVQNVMFRQTLIRAMIKRNLEGGATNTRHKKDEVTFTMRGPAEKIDEIVGFLSSGKEINSWGARATKVSEMESGLSPEEHQVSTKNVDTFNWRKDVEMYL